MLITTAKWLGTIATILGVAFVAFQYFDGKWKSRIERSLHYVLIYQDSDIVAARNEIDLGPLEVQGRNRDLDPTFLEKAQGFRDPDCVKQGVSNVLSFYKGMPHSNVEVIREYFATRCVKEFAEKLEIMASEQGRESPSANKCKEEVYQYAESYLSIDKIKEIIDKDDDTVKPLADLSVEEDINTAWGTVKKFNDGELWWSGKGTSYYYSWPEILWRFFNAKEEEECSLFLEEYESALNFKSEDTLRSLHAIKHFYAALSICTTSGVCDSFVACEAFYREVGTFLEDWQEYLELWSAKEKKSEYDRLHNFVYHCNSNGEFMKYVFGEGMSQVLYAQQFTNYCWRTDEEVEGLCRGLRWIGESGTAGD